MANMPHCCAHLHAEIMHGFATSVAELRSR